MIGPLKDDTPMTTWAPCLDDIGTPCSSPHVSNAALRSLMSPSSHMRSFANNSTV